MTRMEVSLMLDRIDFMHDIWTAQTGSELVGKLQRHIDALLEIDSANMTHDEYALVYNEQKRVGSMLDAVEKYQQLTEK